MNHADRAVMPPASKASRSSAWVIWLAGLLVVAATARLGWWQLDRAAQKISLQQARQAQQALPPLSLPELPRNAAEVQAQLHRSVQLQGQWLADHTVYLENRPMAGRTGFFALTPLRLNNGGVLLVQRGWLPRDQLDRTRIAAPPPPAGTVQLLGRIALSPSRAFEFDTAASGTIRQNLSPDTYAREIGLPLLPFTLVQLDAAADSAAGGLANDGLLRHWPEPDSGVSMHQGYAFQWFALSLTMLLLLLWFQVLRPRRQAGRVPISE